MRLSEYTYDLPQDRIASHPLPERDASKLLVYRGGEIRHTIFRELPGELEPSQTLIFNDTKVIPARLFFQRETGAVIEVFLLEPVLPSPDIATAMTCTGSTTWKCLIGNLRKWKDGESLSLIIDGAEKMVVRASIADRENMLVRLDWDQPVVFSELVELTGRMPLPPYIKREVSQEDKDRYQTVYKRSAGAVAAPTAGLHFTPEVLRALDAKGIQTDYLTLHVSAGTFMPIKDDDISRHKMHGEQIYLTTDNIKNIMGSPKVVAVGTTSMRTLESLYWYGAGLLLSGKRSFEIGQNEPYEHNPENLPSRNEALQAVLDSMNKEGKTSISGRTEIFIHPGYTFRICDGLITNFHLPASTLILLIAAFVGDDWKKIYQEALASGYRFLSYGDSSLLLP